jgi:hypothetical protein
MSRILLSSLVLVLAIGPARAQYYAPPVAAPPADQLVTSWYERFLGRAPDPYAASWIDSLENGQNPASVLASILGSAEFYLRSGNTPQGYIDALFQDLTGQPPRPVQLRFWMNRLYSSNRTKVAYDLLERFPSDWQNAGTTPYYPGNTYGTPPMPQPGQMSPYVPYYRRDPYRHRYD